MFESSTAKSKLSQVVTSANSSKLRDDTDRSDADQYVSDVTQGVRELQNTETLAVTQEITELKNHETLDVTQGPIKNLMLIFG